MRIAPGPKTGEDGPAPFRVLTVCTGNLHRSRLAEGMLAALLAPCGEAFRVSSAGTAAAVGSPMDPVAAALLAEWESGAARPAAARPAGAPGRAARRLTASLVEDADLVLGAAMEHRDAAVRLAPVWALRRAFTLREFARLVRAEDATGLTDPVRRAAALVEGAARRRGAHSGRGGQPLDGNGDGVSAADGDADGDGGNDDVADPYGETEQVARSSARRVAEAVERIATAVLGESGPWRQPVTGDSPDPAVRPPATA